MMSNKHPNNPGNDITIEICNIVSHCSECPFLEECDDVIDDVYSEPIEEEGSVA